MNDRSRRNPAHFRKKPNQKPDGLDETGHRLVLGQQAVREVIRVWGSRTKKVVVLEGAGPRGEALARFATDQGVPVERASRSTMDRIAAVAGGMHQGALAFAPPLVLTPWEEVSGSPDLCAVALDGVVDPQNFGAAVRSAVAVARAPILWSEASSAPLSPATFRASAGAIEHATLCRVPSLVTALEAASALGAEIIGLAPDADVALHEVETKGPVVLVIGSEQKGMSRGVRRACTRLVRLHQAGTVQSLNASVAAGIALYAVATTRATRG